MSITPEQLQEIVDRLPTATSLRQIASDMGLERAAVRQAAQPFITLMQASGALPDCPCGKPRFHPFTCSRGPNARQKMFIDLMLDGMPIKQIARMFDIYPTDVKAAQKYLTDEQRTALKAITARNQAANYAAMKASSARANDPSLVAALIEGRSYRDIKDNLGFSKGTISKAVKKLTPEQAAERERRISESCVRTPAGWAPRHKQRSKGRFVPHVAADDQPSEWRLAA